MSILQNKTEEIKNAITEGEKYTIISCSDMLATTIRTECVINRVESRDKWAQYINPTGLVLVPRGKRKEFGVFVKKTMLILRGWDLGLTIDSDGHSFSGNALLNFVGDPDELCSKIETALVWGAKAKALCTYEIFSAEKLTAIGPCNKRALFYEEAKKYSREHRVMEIILKNQESEATAA